MGLGAAGDAGPAGASAAVAEVTFVGTGAGGTVGEAFVTTRPGGAGRACGRAAVGRAVIWLVIGPGVRKWPIAATASPDATIARVESPMACLEGKERVPGAWTVSEPARSQAICCSLS